MPLTLTALDRAAFDAVIIDLDGTLIDTMGDFVAAINRMIAALTPAGQSPFLMDAPTVNTMVGKGSEHLIRSVMAHLQRCGVRDFTDYDAAFASYQQHYAVVNGRHAEVYPGVQHGLQQMQAAGLRLLCLTNKPQGFARELLALKGLDRFFSQVFGGDSFERKKPDPLPLFKSCEFLGSAPARTLMVGDSSNDAQAARAAGCPVVLVTYGYNHGQPVKAIDADGFVDSLAELRWKAVA
ncbi:phosphoglycolate phosphatase [Polaromonas sp. YR568]|jgi:phosphoglycolate phosphatase|uniref:phosphoglycolate phosphatase n=1 Tax=Polaromonas sp. YR568 TaxID=1855301 RepID=UPI003137F4DA